MAGDVVALIHALHARGIELRAEGDALKLNAPRGAMDAELAARVRSQKPELLAFLHQAAGAGAAAEEVPRVDDGAPLVMTRPQERLWTVAQLHEEGSLYHVPGAWRLSDGVDIDALRASLRAFLQHHEIFRYRFSERDGAPQVALADDVLCALIERDVSGTPEDDRPAALHAFMDVEVDRPFDLESAPALRLYLITEGPDSVVMLVVAHALIWDGWSFDVFLSEMAARYSAAVSGRAPTLAAAPLRFRDYAVWAREREASAVIEQKRRWWHTQLAGSLPPLALPTDDLGGLAHERHGARTHLDIGQELSEQARELARTLGVTTPMLLLAAYVAVLARYGTADEVLVTMPVRGRDHVDFEGIIGVFTNTIFLRIRVQDDPSFAELARRTRDVVLEAMDHDEVPVDRIVEGLEHAGAADGSGLFQVSFSYQQTESRPRSMGGATLSAVDLAVRSAHMDIMLWFRDYGPRLNGGVDYRADRFDAATMVRFREHLAATLRQAVAGPERALSRFVVLTEDEQRAVDGWFDGGPGPVGDADGAVAASNDPPAAQPAAWPARVHAEARLTVGGQRGDAQALEALVESAAAERARAGDSCVASLTEHPRTLADLCAILAALGRGGESEPALLSLEHAALLSPAGEAAAGATAVTVQALETAVAALPSCTAADRVLLLTSLATARGVAELLAALTAGADVVVATAGERASDWALRDLAESQQPTVVFGPAPLLRTLAAVVAPSTAVRLVVVSGPGTGAEVATELARWAPKAERFAIWGPVAAAGVAAKRPLDTPAEASALGAPMRGRRIRVIGPRGELLPLGVLGHVHVGCADGPMEPTGVYASWKVVGTLAHARRGDGGVTIDGRTADPRALAEEIAALPGVRDAFVAAPEAAAGEPVIVAWVALEPGVELGPDTLRAHFDGRCPAAFLPSFVVELAELPRDSSGAISLNALPVPFARPGDADDEALHAGVETVVASIYAEILGLRRVGPHDGFIELGGNSLLALRALSEIERRVGWRPSPRVLFFQTVRQLAQRAESHVATAEASS
ncbi:MAG: condensation domain-containing protein [Myxococcota bacterium]